MSSIALSLSPARSLWSPENRNPLLREVASLVGEVNSALFCNLLVATASNTELLTELSATRRWERYWSDLTAVREIADFETLGHTWIGVNLARTVVGAGIAQGALTVEEASKVLVAMLVHDIPETKTKDKLYMLQTASGDQREVEVFRAHKKEWWSDHLETHDLELTEEIFQSVFHGNAEQSKLTRIARGIDRVSYVLTAADLFEHPSAHCDNLFLGTSVLRNHGRKLLALVQEFPFFTEALCPRVVGLEGLVTWAQNHPSEVRTYIIRDLVQDEAARAIERMCGSEDLCYNIDLSAKMKDGPVVFQPWVELLALLHNAAPDRIPLLPSLEGLRK
jgi:hypothetical protein